MSYLANLLPWTAEEAERARADAEQRAAVEAEAARITDRDNLIAAAAAILSPPMIPTDPLPASSIDQGPQGDVASWMADAPVSGDDWLRGEALAFRERHGASLGVYSPLPL